jgi:ABC-type enterochelin transport system substrate-binding protein
MAILITVDTEEEKQEVLEASRHFHDSNIDTDIPMVNTLSHLHMAPHMVVVKSSEELSDKRTAEFLQCLQDKDAKQLVGSLDNVDWSKITNLQTTKPNVLIIADDLSKGKDYAKSSYPGLEVEIIGPELTLDGYEQDKVILLVISQKDVSTFKGTYISEEKKIEWFKASIFHYKVGILNRYLSGLTMPYFNHCCVLVAGKEDSFSL